MTTSRIFLYLCLSFVGGIFLSSFFKISQGFGLGIFILGLILVLWRQRIFIILGLCLISLVLGIWRYQQAELRVLNNELRKYNNQEKILILIGTIVREPDLREKSQKLIFQPENIKGRILVTTNRYPEYQYGDKLKIIGKLKTPLQDINGFNYKDYLKKDGIYSVMDWPEIELLERENYKSLFSLIYAKILEFKNKLREIIEQNLLPSQSSILGAMILGDKKQLSADLKEKLNVTGLRHITAVSGLHVTILSSILMTLLVGVGLWRQQAFYFSIIFIILFIILTGLQSSAIRAGIMGSLYLLAQYLGKMNVSSRTIVFAASIMLVQNPLLLKLDIGFQLSFLAMIGIIYLMPIFQNWLKKVPNIYQMRDVLAMTLSAQIFTLPILIYNFGYVSLVSPITNVLVVPLLYWIMFFGLLFVFGGLIFQPLGFIFSLPVWFLLNFVLKLVDFFSKLPFASKTIQISWPWLIISYLILGFLVWRLNERQKLKFLQN